MMNMTFKWQSAVKPSSLSVLCVFVNIQLTELSGVSFSFLNAYFGNFKKNMGTALLI